MCLFIIRHIHSKMLALVHHPWKTYTSLAQCLCFAKGRTPCVHLKWWQHLHHFLTPNFHCSHLLVTMQGHLLFIVLVLGWKLTTRFGDKEKNSSSSAKIKWNLFFFNCDLQNMPRYIYYFQKLFFCIICIKWTIQTRFETNDNDKYYIYSLFSNNTYNILFVTLWNILIGLNQRYK